MLLFEYLFLFAIFSFRLEFVRMLVQRGRRDLLRRFPTMHLFCGRFQPIGFKLVWIKRQWSVFAEELTTAENQQFQFWWHRSNNTFFDVSYFLCQTPITLIWLISASTLLHINPNVYSKSCSFSRLYWTYIWFWFICKTSPCDGFISMTNMFQYLVFYNMAF